MSAPLATASTIIPCLRYRDAPAAIEWLCSVLGFERRAVFANEDGSIAHAQLVLGGGMVMLSSVPGEESPMDELQRQPDEIGGVETQSPYLVVADADSVHAKAKAAGAHIVIEIHDAAYGGRGFSCRDKEGHLWHIGTYNPWQQAG